MEIGQKHEDIDVGHMISHDVPILLGFKEIFILYDNLDIEYPEHCLTAPGGNNHKLPPFLNHILCRKDEGNAARDEE